MTWIRDRIVQAAVSVQDYRAAIPESRGPFRDLLGSPPKGASWDLSVPFSCKLVAGKYATRGVSTCGLVSVGIMRLAGMPLPFVGSYWQWPAPYTGLDVVSALSRLGQVTHAAVQTRPVPGDVVCIGSGLATHVLTVVDDVAGKIVSVDGGQIDDWQHGYLQRCKRVTRAWPGPRVVWVLDADRMFAALTSTVPVVEPWTVQDTQRALMRLGFPPGPVDGIAGNLTRLAVMGFQASRGLKVDGIVGKLTRAALQAELDAVGGEG